MAYDIENVFAQIISGKISVNKIYENDYILAINDINPVAPIHILIIPKEQYIDFSDFINNADDYVIISYYRSISEITKKMNIEDYRLITNKGAGCGQTIFHFHTHLISGKKITKLIDFNESVL